MSYCTNCGEKTSEKKTCEKCGVALQTTHNFCRYCGTSLEANAKNCPACKEKTKKESIIVKILCYVIGVLLMIAALGMLGSGGYISAVFFALSGVLLLPVVKSLIRKITCDKPKVHNILMIVRIAVLAILIVGAFATAPKSDNDAGSVSSGLSDSADDVKDIVIKNQNQAINAAKDYISENSRRIEQQLADECGFTKFYSPEYATYSTKTRSDSWTVTAKGEMSGYIDDYGTDFESYKIEVNISVSIDGTVRLSSVEKVG